MGGKEIVSLSIATTSVDSSPSRLAPVMLYPSPSMGSSRLTSSWTIALPMPEASGTRFWTPHSLQRSAMWCFAWGHGVPSHRWWKTTALESASITIKTVKSLLTPRSRPAT